MWGHLKIHVQSAELDGTKLDHCEMYHAVPNLGLQYQIIMWDVLLCGTRQRTVVIPY